MKLSLWETVLSEIIVGDAFGVDRMDYLLRDSLHAGVVYGHFDHYRILDSIRLLPSPPTEAGQNINQLPPTLGITEGGLHSADAMLLARYFMFSQLYFHPIRRIYDIHLKDFLLDWQGQFPTEVDKLLAFTDNEVVAAMYRAAMNAGEKGHDSAKRLINHTHFKVVYRRRKKDVDINPEAARLIFESAAAKFGNEKLRYDKPRKAMALSGDFPVLTNTQEVVSSSLMSEALPQVPPIIAEFVYADRDIAEDVAHWIDSNTASIIGNKLQDEDEESKEGAK